MIGFLLVALAVVSWICVIAFTPPAVMLVGCAMLLSFALGIMLGDGVRKAMRPTPELTEEMERKAEGGIASW